MVGPPAAGKLLHARRRAASPGMQCRCFARAIGSAYDRPAASKPAPRISIVPASASRRAAVVVEDIGYSLDQARNDLADGAQHNADKAKPTQPIIAALQSDLI
jgi:hypothetical protein